MEIDRWHPSTTLSKREERLMKRLTRTRKLFGFLRMHKHELFYDAFQAEFDPETCGRCPMRTRCTMAAPGTGRTVSIARDEQLQHRFRKLTASPRGRERLRG